MISTPAYLRIVAFGSSAVGGAGWPLNPGNVATVLGLHSIWSIVIAIALGFLAAIGLDVEGDLDDDEEGPMTLRKFAWLPASVKMWDVAGTIAAIGCGMLAKGLYLSPHNYFGLLPIIFSLGLSLGIWFAYAWPPRSDL
jgi:hypothetical protein